MFVPRQNFEVKTLENQHSGFFRGIKQTDSDDGHVSGKQMFRCMLTQLSGSGSKLWVYVC